MIFAYAIARIEFDEGSGGQVEGSEFVIKSEEERPFDRNRRFRKRYGYMLCMYITEYLFQVAAPFR